MQAALHYSFCVHAMKLKHKVEVTVKITSLLSRKLFQKKVIYLRLQCDLTCQTFLRA